MSVFGPSMGKTPQAIPNRLARREQADIFITARSALDELVRKGRVVNGSQVKLVRSRVAMAVKSGARMPDISSVEALKRAMLEARSIAYSDSASGVYIEKELIPRLGIAVEVASKARMIPATPVGLIVARGEAELGFQQLCLDRTDLRLSTWSRPPSACTRTSCTASSRSIRTRSTRPPSVTAKWRRGGSAAPSTAFSLLSRAKCSLTLRRELYRRMACSEPRLIELGYAFERATKARVAASDALIGRGLPLAIASSAG